MVAFPQTLAIILTWDFIKDSITKIVQFLKMTCTVLCQIIYKKFSSHTIQFNISQSQGLCFPELCSRTLCWYETFVVLQVMGCSILVWICNICAATQTHILPLSQALDPSIHIHSVSLHPSVHHFHPLKSLPSPSTHFISFSTLLESKYLCSYQGSCI